jgi:uncharacterized phage infection (PIP) family protein YhgE
MSIDDGFKKLLEGVKRADEGRDEIMRGLEEAWAGRKDLDQQFGELRDTIAGLQQLIMDQGVELRALRTRLEGGTP